MLSVRANIGHSINDAADMGLSTRQLSTKTPGRRLVAANVPRTMKKENAITNGAQTGKGKRIMYPSTPGAGLEKIQPQFLFQEPAGSSMKATTSLMTVVRANPLLDKTNKTPYILRQHPPSTPLPNGPSKLNLLTNAASTPLSSLQFLPSDSITGAPAAPATVLRPSSTRKSFRAPRSSSTFETPDRHGRKPHWDVSDGDISVELGSTGPVLEDVIMEEDDDEVEYAPSPSPDPEDGVGFDVPDYKALGAAVMAFAKCPNLGYDHWTERTVLCQDAVEEVPCTMPGLMDPIDEDSPFPTRKAPPASGRVGGLLKGKAPAIRINSRAVTPAVSRPPTRLTVASKSAAGPSRSASSASRPVRSAHLPPARSATSASTASKARPVPSTLSGSSVRPAPVSAASTKPRSTHVATKPGRPVAAIQPSKSVSKGSIRKVGRQPVKTPVELVEAVELGSVDDTLDLMDDGMLLEL